MLGQLWRLLLLLGADVEEVFRTRLPTFRHYYMARQYWDCVTPRSTHYRDSASTMRVNRWATLLPDSLLRIAPPHPQGPHFDRIYLSWYCEEDVC